MPTLQTPARRIRHGASLFAAALLSIVAACSDAPSGLSAGSTVRPTSKIPDSRDPAEIVSFRSSLVTSGNAATADAFTATANGGIAMIDRRYLAPVADDAAPSLALRLWDTGGPRVAKVRRARSTLRLPDGRLAVVERESLADGTPTTLRARVGDAEFVWSRTWTRRGGRNELLSSVAESRLRGAVVSRSVLNVQSRRVAALRSGFGPGSSKRMLELTRRYGALAGALLLPRILNAQTDGMVCSTAAKSLTAAWTAWRVATVAWFVSFAVGGVTKATAAELTASAAVDVAESNYIDCYVAATSAGVPDYRIAPPPVEDEP
ncbi:MAG: hypothetical protein P3B98_00050 [Gemmatimonadota bacterium]|nr:hypothetical protein [Gemmatimonadota bacterium]